MTTKHIVFLGLAIGLALIAGLVLHAYIGSRVQLAQLSQLQKDISEANRKADDIKKQAEQDRQAAEARDAQRDRQLSLSLAAIVAQKQQPVTADQVAAMIAARIPQAQITAQQLESLPDAPAAEKSIRDYILDCDACTVERDSLKQAVANRDDQIKALETEKQAIVEQKANVEKERDAAVKAARGGSVIQRVFRAMKYVGIGIGIGASLTLIH